MNKKASKQKLNKDKTNNKINITLFTKAISPFSNPSYHTSSSVIFGAR